MGLVRRGDSSGRLLGLFRLSGAGLSCSSGFEEVKSGNQTAAGCVLISSGQVFEAAWPGVDCFSSLFYSLC